MNEDINKRLSNIERDMSEVKLLIERYRSKVTEDLNTIRLEYVERDFNITTSLHDEIINRNNEIDKAINSRPGRQEIKALRKTIIKLQDKRESSLSKWLFFSATIVINILITMIVAALKSG